MVFAHSFWSKPLLAKKFDTFENSLQIILFSYTMSAEMVRAFGHDIILYTDEYGKDLLSVAPYTDIVVLDIPDTESEHFAAQIKFEALKRMELGQILIDGDLFLWKYGIYDIIEKSNADVLCSIYEDNDYILKGGIYAEKFGTMLEKMSEATYEEPFILPKLEELGWPNTSLMKFNSQELKDKYIQQYEHHKGMLTGIDFGKAWPDVIIEQQFLQQLCDGEGYDIKPALEDFENNEDKAVELGFTHLGSMKNQKIGLAVNWIRENDPQRFMAILQKIQETINNQKKLRELYTCCPKEHFKTFFNFH